MSGEQRRFELSVPQILGSALAAVTAAVAASYLGVAGTVIGAAVVSVASTVATAVYTHYLKRTGERVKQRTPLVVRREELQGELQEEPEEDERADERDEGDVTLVMPAVGPASSRWRLPWLKVGAAAAIVFGVSMGSILVYQAAAQQTVHEQVTGKGPAKVQQKRQEEERGPVTRETGTQQPPAYLDPSVTPEDTPEPTPTPTPTRTVTPTREPTPTPAPTPSDTVEPSQEGTPTPPPAQEQPDVIEEAPSPGADRAEPEYDTPPA
ncbi:hypothetical protein [Nonomuraea rubra]|uniref:Uncharacterized protein n=1 Tax=Nonomuraea rubra TaxID=46180 RepID=A0A7X0NR01_9ACTN|nr:hypothetical protein [Nonomuraea rubra]MBB6547942.1 hypothetical protein [Nonomuraea rubra]